jgi:hypothetical protein
LRAPLSGNPLEQVGGDLRVSRSRKSAKLPGNSTHDPGVTRPPPRLCVWWVADDLVSRCEVVLDGITFVLSQCRVVLDGQVLEGCAPGSLFVHA